MRHNPSFNPPPKKSLGQHFLSDPVICERIVSLLFPHATDNIIEIGPGSGALTKFLRSAPHSNLILLEKDTFWSREQNFNKKGEPLVINCDALDFGWRKLEKLGNWKIIGNLPYNIASPLIWNIVSQCKSLARAVFMIQKEVAARLTAKPDNKHYGALTAWVQNFTQVKNEFSLAPGAFTPPPKVYSTVVSFTPVDNPPKKPCYLNQLLNLCFQKRRKQLGTIFKQAKKISLINGLEELNIDPVIRPENLTPMQFRQLSAYWQ